MALELDALLRVRGPEASFHDSWITSIAIDYRAASADLRFDVPVGSEGNSYTYESGTLRLRGLLFIAIEPPNELPDEGGSSVLWVTADGEFPDEKLSSTVVLPPDLPGGCHSHYLFCSNTNSSIVFCAREVLFQWESA